MMGRRLIRIRLRSAIGIIGDEVDSVIVYYLTGEVHYGRDGKLTCERKAIVVIDGERDIVPLSQLLVVE